MKAFKVTRYQTMQGLLSLIKWLELLCPTGFEPRDQGNGLESSEKAAMIIQILAENRQNEISM